MRRNACVSLSLVVVACGGPPKPTPLPDPVVNASPPEPDERDEPLMLRAPKAEITAHTLNLPLPAVPTFELPAADPGFHGPRELLVQGRALFGTQIRVKGYVTWIYDCVADVQKPGMTLRETRKAIEEDPTRCERPKLYLGDTPTTPPEASIWVVDVPRPPNKLEKQRLPRAELASWPRVPRIKVGDYVAISGTWSISSPHSEVNSDGLLVYADLVPAVAGQTKGTLPPPQPSMVQAATPPTPAPRAKVSRADRDASAAQLETCLKSYGLKQFETAVVECERAITLWPDNHVAWYARGGAQAQLGSWADAVTAFERAVAIEPTEPIYHQVHGIGRYEAAIAAAREAEALRQGRKPDEVIPDLAGVDFDPALASLLLAVKLEPALWRSHLTIGRIHRTRDRARGAAEAFGRAIASNPYEADPYVALAELYRRWGYLDEAIAVAGLGTQHIPGARESANAWYVLAMSYGDKRLDDRALEAFDRVLTLARDHAGARFQRAQIYMRKGEHEKARRDLEAFVRSSLPRSAFDRGNANRLLLEIAAKAP